MRNAFVFKKRPNSLIKTWAGIKVPVSMKNRMKDSKPLFKRKPKV